MKIDFVINSLIAGGAERVMVLLADHFASKGHDVTIITFNEPEEFKFSDNVKRVRLHHGKISNHTIRSIKNLTSYYRRKNNRPNVIIPFMTHGNFIGILVGRLLGIKVLSSEHNNHLKKTDRIGHFTKKYLYRYSNALTVLTSFDVEYYKKNGAKVYIMPNPCSFNILENRENPREKVAVAVGNLDRYHHKGFDNLIPLIAPVLKENPEWRLKIVGAGKDGLIFLTDLAETHGISEQVEFTGFSSNVAEIMKKSEIFILSSRFEGLPMVMLEAMSQGLACVSYNCKTGPSDIIQDGVNGLLVEDQDQEAMANALRRIINDGELRSMLGKQALGSLERFDMNAIYENYLKIFKEIGAYSG
ncbi:MAG: glycosyltransferase family 4 protein [Bacteroidota bacterium]|nr:glycosyltransferase family 4 protein [Bacteroidota bacterium]